MAMEDRKVDVDVIKGQLGLQWPPMPQDLVNKVNAKWQSIKFLSAVELLLSSPEEHERVHVEQVNKLLEAARSVGAFPTCPLLKLVGIKNQPINWQWCSDSESTNFDFRPDAAIVRQGVTLGTLQQPGGARKVRVAVEVKKAKGASELGQVGSYATAFRLSGSRYSLGLSIRHTTLKVFLFSSTAWSIIAEANYYNRDDDTHLLSALSYLVTTKEDTLFSTQWAAGFPLVAHDEAKTAYSDGLQPGSIAWDAPRACFQPACPDVAAPLFTSSQVFGSRTQVWFVEGSLVDESGHEMEAGSFVITAKHLRPGKALNTMVFTERLRQQMPSIASCFEHCVGLWLDESGLTNGDRRILAVQLFRGPLRETWADAASKMLPSQVWTAFADGARLLWASKSLHHRDVSPLNLLWVRSGASNKPRTLTIAKGEQLSCRLLDVDDGIL